MICFSAPETISVSHTLASPLSCRREETMYFPSGEIVGLMAYISGVRRLNEIDDNFAGPVSVDGPFRSSDRHAPRPTNTNTKPKKTAAVVKTGLEDHWEPYWSGAATICVLSSKTGAGLIWPDGRPFSPPSRSGLLLISPVQQ